MTLKEIVNALNSIAEGQHLVNSVVRSGNVYEINENPDVKYATFCAVQQSHSFNPEDSMMGYNFTLYYVDRLTSNASNKVDIQSTAIQVLTYVIKTFAREYEDEVEMGENISYEVFTDSFNDLCAGAYATVQFRVMNDGICPDEVLTHCEVCYNAGYSSGYTDGSAGGGGDWHSGYTSGYTDGEEAQKAKLSSSSFTVNGSYTLADGWSAITVEVPQYSGRTYEEGYEDGVAAQKAKLSYTSVTANGTYYREDGYSAFTVNVAQTGYTKEDLDAAYQSGYTDGLNDCQTPEATAITLNVDSVITDSGATTTTVSPSSAETNLVYSSSDTTKATIDENGNITVLGDGQVTFCVTDLHSQLQDCKTVSVVLSSNYVSLDFIYETTGANQTIRLFTGEAQNRNQVFYAFYSGITSMEIDGQEVQKSPSNIHISSPFQSYDYYFYTFESAGLHTVKYVVSSTFSASTNSGPYYPGKQLSSLMFSSNEGEIPLVLANIGEGYETLAGMAFQGNQTLTSVTFPSTLTSIGNYTFEYSGLKQITCMGTVPPAIGNNAFYQVNTLEHIYVPAEAVNTYKTASGWSNYASIIEAL